LKMAITDVAELPATKNDTDTAVEEMCDVCTHSLRIHDAISSRFCAATMAGAFDRGCVCKPE
jgi:hypothetical protein